MNPKNKDIISYQRLPALQDVLDAIILFRETCWKQRRLEKYNRKPERERKITARVLYLKSMTRPREMVSGRDRRLVFRKVMHLGRQ